MPDPNYNKVLQLLTEIRDERRTHANTANRVGTAMIELLSYVNYAPFLRSDKAESVRYLLTLLQGAVVGESGHIRLNPDGSIVCSSIKVNGSAIFDELVFNDQNVLEGDTYFTDKGVIEEVVALGDRQFKLIFRKEYDNDIITFHEDDILKCVMNNLDVGKTKMVSFSRINSIDLDENSVNVTLYDDEDVDGGLNFAPQAGAKAVRWGNPTDESRQQTFFVSSNDGRFLFLQGVTQPKMTDGNYAAFIGVPPDLDCLKNLPLNRRHPYIFARGLIVQDIIKIDYQGNPEYTIRELGDWDDKRQYINGYDTVANGYYTDRAWCDGSLWEAAVARPTIGVKPSLSNADWVRRLHSGQDGIDGKDGKDGINGKDGKDGINGKDGKDGADGIDGVDGINGVDGKDGKDGKDGSDGTSVRTAYSFNSYPSEPWEGMVVLIDYDDASTDMIDVLENGVWESYIVDIGSVYICDLDHHYYEATATGWRDCGRFTGTDGKDGKDGTNGVDGKDGEDAVFYEIVPSVSAVRRDSAGAVTTGVIAMNAYYTKGGNRTACVFTTSSAQRYIIYFSIDGADWVACSWINASGSIVVYGVPASRVQSATRSIAFRLAYYDSQATPAEKVVFESAGIPVVSDGSAGTAGKSGKNYYYAQTFDPAKEYTATEYQAPYVSYEWQDGNILRVSQYMLIADTNRVNGVLVAPRTAAAAGVWELMTNDFTYLITVATFTDFGKLASSVFTGDWRISQYGVPARAISARERSNLKSCVEVDGQYPVSDLAMLLSGEWSDKYDCEWAEIFDWYVNESTYSEEDLTEVVYLCQWAVSAMPNLTDDERFEVLQNLSNSSYQYFGINPSDPFAVFKPNIAEDMLAGKTYLRDVYIRGAIVKNTVRITADNASDYCKYGGAASYGSDRLFLDLPSGYQLYQIEFLKDSNEHSAVTGRTYVLLPEITEDMVGSEIVLINATDTEGDTAGVSLTVQSGTANPFAATNGDKNRWLMRGIPRGVLNNSIYNSDSNPNGNLKRATLPVQYEMTLRAVHLKKFNVNLGEYGWIIINNRTIL